MRTLGLMLLAGTMLSATMVRAEEDCTTAPDCSKLGYTMDASLCGGAALYCPWDLTKAMCKEKSPLPILYGDGTVSNIIKSNPKPIGVVFDEANKLAIALTEIKADGKPGSKNLSMISNVSKSDLALPRCTEDSLKTCGVDGRYNTDVLLRTLRPGVAIAPQGANLYEPEGCTASFCKKNKWFIPSARDLLNVGEKYTDISKTLTLLSDLGGVKLSNVLWSSTLDDTTSTYGGRSGWYVNLSTKNSRTMTLNSKWSVRPIIYYGDEITKTDFSVPCEIGALLGGDGKCYTTKLNSAVSVVGVVFDTEKRLAVALTNVKKDGTAGSQAMAWSTSTSTYNTSLADCFGNTLDTCGTDGRANTNVLLKATSGGTYEAAQAVNKYEPTGCTAAFCKKTKWFLPSFNEAEGFQGRDQHIIVSNALNLIPGLTTTEPEGYYWTSTEASKDKAWKIGQTGVNTADYKYSTTYYVRPVVKY